MKLGGSFTQGPRGMPSLFKLIMIACAVSISLVISSTSCSAGGSWASYVTGVAGQFSASVESPVDSPRTPQNASNPASTKERVPGAWSETAMQQATFADAMRAVPWKDFDDAAKASDRKEVHRLTQLLLDSLMPFIAREPPVPANATCAPPTLPPPESIDCAAGLGHAFVKGKRRAKAAKVAHIVQLGPDVDVLWMMLEELDDVVDYFFLLESTRTHSNTLRKALFWEQVRHQPRFYKFKDKVVHIILDDPESMVPIEDTTKPTGFTLENKQEKARWESFLRWNEQMGQYFSDEDIVGFGDVDEIPSRENVHRLRWCEFAGPSIDVGVWFVPGDTRLAFQSDFPVSYEQPWTLGDPSYFTVASAKAKGNPSRQRGTSNRFVLGGAHLSDNPYLPFIISKLLACSDCVQSAAPTVELLRGYLEEPTPQTIRDLEVRRKRLTSVESRMATVDQLLKDTSGSFKDVHYVPWFYECNPKLFPAWTGGHDTRLD